MRSFTSLLVAVCALAASVASAQTCPPAGFTSKANLNPFKYFNGSWYTLKQIPVAFQPANNRYCVSGEISSTIANGTIALSFFNGGSIGGVTGNRSTALLSGSIPDFTTPGEALVGPANGPYWVVDAGSYTELLTNKTECVDDNYEWAIVTGGAPVSVTSGGCLPQPLPNNRRGFWLLSRQSVVSQEILDTFTARAASKGLDVTALITIPQEGCTYKNPQ